MAVSEEVIPRRDESSHVFVTARADDIITNTRCAFI
jgi:hypothetical protein